MLYKTTKYIILSELRDRFNCILNEHKLWHEIAIKINLDKKLSYSLKYIALLHCKNKIMYYTQQLEQLELLSIGGLAEDEKTKLTIH